MGILYLYILCIPDIRYQEGISSAMVWSYLTSHLDIRRLSEWMESRYPLSPEAGDTPVGWPYTLSLEVELLDRLEQCPTYLREQVLNVAARYDIYFHVYVQSKDFALMFKVK